jgi:hypothetical protein
MLKLLVLLLVLWLLFKVTDGVFKGCIAIFTFVILGVVVLAFLGLLLKLWWLLLVFFLLGVVVANKN